MNTSTNQIILALLILIIGFGAGYFTRGSQMPEMGEHLMADGSMMKDGGVSMDTAMNDMMQDLKGKTGDAFDKAFLSGMIEHHQGAVEMAQAALVNANHQEIKDMAQAIIAGQTPEINQMKEWQTSWYGGQ